MSSKAAILKDIEKNKPASRPLPSLPPDPLESATESWEVAFREVLAASKTSFVAPEDLTEYIQAAGYDTIVSNVPEFAGNLELDTIDDPLQLAGVDLAILPARVGVAENGAMWVSETESVHRILPFITQHLILILERKHLVGTMHEAYRKVRVNDTGFGVFIAGPSKTADIEQSLVIGAHGPRSLVVCLRD